MKLFHVFLLWYSKGTSHNKRLCNMSDNILLSRISSHPYRRRYFFKTQLLRFVLFAQVVKPKLARPGRVSVTACAWGLNGNCVAGGLADGSIQVSF